MLSTTKTCPGSRRALIVAIAALGGLACAPEPSGSDAGGCPASLPESCPATAPSYSGEIAAIVQTKCVVCHTAGGPGAEWPLGSWSEVNTLAQQGIVQEEVASCMMPEADAGQLTDSEREAILTWLVCGAPNN